jgi:hypothetical protein
MAALFVALAATVFVAFAKIALPQNNTRTIGFVTAAVS